MPYIARADELPEIAQRGGLVDPRADHQHAFNKRISCRDVTDFISNTAEVSPLELRDKKAAARHTADNKSRLYKILARTNELNRPFSVRGAEQPISDLLPGQLGRTTSTACCSLGRHCTPARNKPSRTGHRGERPSRST